MPGFGLQACSDCKLGSSSRSLCSVSVFWCLSRLCLYTAVEGFRVQPRQSVSGAAATACCCCLSQGRCCTLGGAASVRESIRTFSELPEPQTLCKPPQDTSVLEPLDRGSASKLQNNQEVAHLVRGIGGLEPKALKELPSDASERWEVHPEF